MAASHCWSMLRHDRTIAGDDGMIAQGWVVSRANPRGHSGSSSRSQRCSVCECGASVADRHTLPATQHHLGVAIDVLNGEGR